MQIEQEKLENAIKEVGREIGLRRNVYPKWIQSGRLTKEKSDEQIQNMAYAYEVLKYCKKILFVQIDRITENAKVEL